MQMPTWYRSAAVGGMIYEDEFRKTQRLTLEAFLFTFGKKRFDKERAKSLEEAIEVRLDEIGEERNIRVVRVYTSATESFTPVNPSESKGLGGYRIGWREEDKTVAKIDVRLRQYSRTIVVKILKSIAKAIFGRY